MLKEQNWTGLCLLSVIRNINIKFATGEKLEYNESSVTSITTAEVFQTTLGRCHQIQIKADNKPVSAVEFIAKVPIYIYVNMAGQFTNENSKSKVEVKVQQRLYIDVRIGNRVRAVLIITFSGNL